MVRVTQSDLTPRAKLKDNLRSSAFILAGRLAASSNSIRVSSKE
jgi:hypothetical protein